MLPTSATFDSLYEEKKLLLHTIDQQNKPASAADREQQHQAGQQEQMNNLHKRLHAEVQHMSAFDRYKRKKRNSTAEPSTAIQHAAASRSPPPTTTEAKTQGQSRRNIIDLEIFRPLRDLHNQAVDVGKKFSEIVLIECTETRLQQLAELEQNDRTGIWSPAIDYVKQCIQSEIQQDRQAEQACNRGEQRENEKGDFGEQARIRREQREEERRQAGEQARIRNEQREEERIQAGEQARIRRERREEEMRQAQEQARIRRDQLEDETRQAQEQIRIRREQREEVRRQAEEQVRLPREQREKETKEAEEQYRLEWERRARERREADEQGRLRRERAERESEERLQKELARIQLGLVKSQADYRCRVAWLERLPLVRHRRANKSANAG